MTTTALGYNIPSSFKMIQRINNEQPKMLQVHQDEFDRINKLTNLSKPYIDYVRMLYIKYICNTPSLTSTINHTKPKHIGMKMLENLNN